jgi:[protein-PII] uridylyltransferase
MLAPYSDVDVLFLMPNKSPPGMEKVVEALLYVLWDLRLKVGHATRTIDECLKQARADMTIRTTVVEARFITGDKALFETLRIRFDKEIVAKTAAEFVAAKLAERETRVRKAGASRYLVEPNVKEGKGGLRDLNTLFWIIQIRLPRFNPSKLVTTGCSRPGVLALSVMRGIPLERTADSTSCRPGGRRLSFDVQLCASTRLFDAGGDDRRRAVHEALLPHRQGRRRPDRDRVRGARGATHQNDACVRPPRRPLAKAHPRDRGS